MKYQRKIKREIADLYQSNDPLRYVYLANRFGINRHMTRRELKYFKRSINQTFKHAAQAAKDMMTAFSSAMTNAATSIKALAEAMKSQQFNSPHVSITVEPKIAPIDDNLSDRLLMRHRLVGDVALQMPKMPALSVGSLIVDEAMNIDDETLEKMKKALNND